MSIGRLEMKVGIFVVVLLGLAAAMSIKFSNTGFGLGDTYSIRLKTDDAGTIIKNAPVLMSGVKVGYVDEINLDLHGSVTLTVKLYSKYADNIDVNAKFEIKSSGFLGDQFIGVFPPVKRTEPLGDGAQRPCEPPFDIMSVGRDAQELIISVSARVQDLNATIVKINEGLLSEKTLRGFTDSIGTISKKIKEFEDLNATKVSQDVMITSRQLRDFSADLNSTFANNRKDVTDGIADLRSAMKKLKDLSESQKVTDAVENIEKTSSQLRDFTADLNSTFANNRTTITNVIGSIDVVTKRLVSITDKADKIAGRLDAGEGIAGTLLKDEKVKDQFKEILGNLSKTMEHIKILSKNLKDHGLLHKGQKKKEPKEEEEQPRSRRP